MSNQKQKYPLTLKQMASVVGGTIVAILVLAWLLSLAPAIQQNSMVMAAFLLLAFSLGGLSTRLYDRWRVNYRRERNFKAALREIGLEE
jgi:hypothetical protein